MQSGFTVGDLLASNEELIETDLPMMQDLCNTTLSAIAAYERYAALCFGMRNTVGVRVFYQKVFPTGLVVEQNAFLSTLNNLWAKSIDDGIISLRWLR